RTKIRTDPGAAGEHKRRHRGKGARPNGERVKTRHGRQRREFGQNRPGEGAFGVKGRLCYARCLPPDATLGTIRHETKLPAGGSTMSWGCAGAGSTAGAGATPGALRERVFERDPPHRRDDPRGAALT